MAPAANRSRRRRLSKTPAARRKRHTRPLASRSPLSPLSSPNHRRNSVIRGGSGRSSPFGKTKPVESRIGKRRWKPSKPTLLPPSFEPYEKNCFERQPIPQGYVFVPKGDVYITRHCRLKTKESRRIVYVVYDKSGKKPLGLRVPSDIDIAVRESAAETADSRANVVKLRDEKSRAHSHQLLRSQFPLMPDETLEKILDHAFLRGSGRVGRTSGKADTLKANLAVEAHIRHNHTPYEAMLHEGRKRNEARSAVWATVQGIKAVWEGAATQPMSLLTVRNRMVESS